jgi:predicted glycosyltransferase
MGPAAGLCMVIDPVSAPVRRGPAMRVLVEILHPAHVHFFRNAIAAWTARGDQVLVLSREKDVANDLLDSYAIPYESISRLGSSKLALLGEMLVRDTRMFRRARTFRPDVLVGIMGVTIVQVGRLIGRPAVVFYDTENAKVTNAFVYPLAHSVCTPECYAAPVRGKHVTYPGYHELAYLHPQRFTPDRDIVRRAGVNPDEPYFIVRFVSWQASHDVGETGFDLDQKRAMVAELERHGRVLISSESPLPEELEALRFRAPAAEMHHFIAFARMLVGESATMASEAAVLGVPAFYIADTGRGYTDEEERRFGLVWNFKRRDAARALAKIQELLARPTLREDMLAARTHLLQERIDVTDWLIDYVDGVVAECLSA